MWSKFGWQVDYRSNQNIVIISEPWSEFADTVIGISDYCIHKPWWFFKSVDYLFEGLFKTEVRTCGQHNHNLWLVYAQILNLFWSASANKHLICAVAMGVPPKGSVDYLFEGLFKTEVRICGQHNHNLWLVDTHILTIVWSASATYNHNLCVN